MGRATTIKGAEFNQETCLKRQRRDGGGFGERDQRVFAQPIGKRHNKFPFRVESPGDDKLLRSIIKNEL